MHRYVRTQTGTDAGGQEQIKTGQGSVRKLNRQVIRKPINKKRADKEAKSVAGNREREKDEKLESDSGL